MQLDISTGIWHPAARAVYSDFFPLVPTSSVHENGIEEKRILKIIPNPAENEALIKCDVFFRELRVYNSKGQLCIYKAMHVKSKQYEVDVSGLPAGVYLVTATGEEPVMLSGKMIVE